MTKKILIIGAGIGQVNLCLLAKSRGLEVIVVTIQGNYPCISIADKVYYIDIYEKDKIVEIAKQEQIQAVVSDQNDLMMPTVAFVAEKLHLKGNTINQVNSYCNKNIYRDNCDKIGIPTPKHVNVPYNSKYVHIIPDSLENSLPLIVKPEDSQSSKGVSVVRCKKDYVKAVEFALKYSKNKSVIVEEFFEGKEIVAEGFVLRGKYYCLGIADRKYFHLEDKFIPSQTIFPSLIAENLKQKIIDYEQRYSNFSQIEFAIIHSEYLINEVGEIKVVESAVRGGGVYISSHLVPLFTNININDVLLSCCLNEFDEKQISRLEHIEERASAYICFFLPEGEVVSVTGLEEIHNLNFVHKCDVSVKVGDKTRAIEFKGDRYGPIIIDGENRNDIEKKISEIQQLLHIEVKQANGKLSDIIW